MPSVVENTGQDLWAAIERGINMTPRRIANLRRARELDDEYPDLVCPGCQGDIFGWWEHYAHVAGEPAVQVRFWDAGPGAASSSMMCPWTSDYLSARMHRRRLIREAIANGEQLVAR
jgi:hypothetical protein